MPVRHIRNAIGEAGSLLLYAGCSVLGAVLQPEPHLRGERRPVVLVPGFLGRGLAFSRLKRALAKEGYPVYIADLGFGVGCIEEKGRLLEELVTEHELEDFYVIGHSMGGLIAMSMSDEVRRKVRHFITMGTTFHGAVLSYLFPLFPAARQLNPDSRLVRRIAERARAHDNITSVIAEWDEIALPVDSCRVEGCEEVTGVAGHAQLILRSSAIEQLVYLVDELEAG